jgi:hypothetical protein
MEGKEWIWNNGMLEEKVLDRYRKAINNSSSNNLTERKLEVFESFLRNIKIS